MHWVVKWAAGQRAAGGGREADCFVCYAGLWGLCAAAARRAAAAGWNATAGVNADANARGTGPEWGDEAAASAGQPAGRGQRPRVCRGVGATVTFRRAVQVFARACVFSRAFFAIFLRDFCAHLALFSFFALLRAFSRFFALSARFAHVRKGVASDSPVRTVALSGRRCGT